MRRMTATLAGLFALATVSARSAPNTNSDKWVWLGSGLSFGLGDQGCGEGSAAPPTTRLARRVVLGIVRPNR